MKPFKKQIELKLFGIRFVLTMSTYRYEYKIPKPNAKQTDLFEGVKNDGTANATAQDLHGVQTGM